MSGVPYIRFFGDDWLSGTQELTLEERGVLATIVALTAATGHPPAADYGRLSRRLGCTQGKAKKLIAALSDLGKIEVVDGEIINKRALKETEFSQKKSEKNSENASARWSKPDGKSNKINGGSDATAMRPQCDRICQPEPEPEYKKETTSVVSKKEPELELPLVDDPPPKPKPKAKAKRAVAIPENWIPSEKNIEDARARNFSDKEIEDEASRFRDFHLARGSTFKDWNAAWRTWLSNARRYNQPQRSRPASRPSAASDALLAGFAGAISEIQGRG